MTPIEQLIEALRDYLASPSLDGRADRQRLRQELGELLDKIKKEKQNENQNQDQNQNKA
jgi:hypothetical protein